MNIIKNIISDKEILNKYKAIDTINKYPFNHGMKHINNVVCLVDKIAPLFNLSKREIEILKTCEILHDLGQVDGRDNHGLKAAIFAKEYLPKLNYFTNNEIEIIYSAINTHDEKNDYTKLENKFSWFVNFIDKMDFSRNRLEDNYEDKFGYIEYNDIESIDFNLASNIFQIKIITIPKPKVINEEKLFERSFFNKVVNTSLKFSNHFNLSLEMYLNNTKLDLTKMDISKINS